MARIEKSTVSFLRKLAKNNNREWFNEHKPEFKTAENNLKAFLAELASEMNRIDQIEKTKLFRIYRDVRFSKDKTPYNEHYSMSLSRAGADRRGGYYFRIQPKESFVACGFWKPEPGDLKLIRDHISRDARPLRKIIESSEFRETFGSLEGEQLKNTPRGYDKDHPDSDLLRFKQFIVTKTFPTSEVTEEQFIERLVSTFSTVRPWFDYMSEILTHDLDGVPLIKNS